MDGFGAHFDVAPPANAVLLDLNVGFRTYGTRAGAYDNSAGTAMVMETARALQILIPENHGVLPMVGEGGKRGRLLDEYHVKEDNPQVTVMNTSISTWLELIGPVEVVHLMVILILKSTKMVIRKTVKCGL